MDRARGWLGEGAAISRDRLGKSCVQVVTKREGKDRRVGGVGVGVGKGVEGREGRKRKNYLRRQEPSLHTLLRPREERGKGGKKGDGR